MDKLRAIKYFLKVAETSNFTEAAKAFNVPASSVSRRIRDLETSLGVELFQRSTRIVRLTELGSLYYDQVHHVVDALADAEDTVGHLSDAPSGTLRITAMPGYGASKLIPALEKFQRLYPDIVLDVELTDQVSDLVRSRIDIALRGTANPPERAVARPLVSNQFILMASPQYLAHRGTPTTVRDIEKHDALLYRAPVGVLRWHGRSGVPDTDSLSEQDGWRELSVQPVMISNHGQSLAQAAADGRGLVLLPKWAVEDAKAKNGLVQINLSDGIVSSTRAASPCIYLVYYKPKYRVQKVKLMVDFLMRELGGDLS